MATKIKFKKGDKVIILTGPYTGQSGEVLSVWSDGCAVKRDVPEERNICPVRFEHLQKYETNS